MEINDLFEAALQHIVSSLEVIQSDERHCVAAACNTVLQQKTRRQLSRLWDSPLYDYLAKALASVTGRPLHIHGRDQAARLCVCHCCWERRAHHVPTLVRRVPL